MCNSANILNKPLPFYGTQIINRFLSSMLSVNHDKLEGFQPIVKSLYPLLFTIVKKKIICWAIVHCSISWLFIETSSTLNLDYLFIFNHTNRYKNIFLAKIILVHPKYVRIFDAQSKLLIVFNIDSPQLSLTGNSLKKMSKISSHFFLGKVTCPELPLSITK